MTPDDYQDWQPLYSQYTRNEYADSRLFEMAGIIGLNAEAGELLELVQKAIRKDITLDREKVIDELGDVFWYFNYILNAFDSSLEEVMKYNKMKLDKRNGA